MGQDIYIFKLIGDEMLNRKKAFDILNSNGNCYTDTQVSEIIELLESMVEVVIDNVEINAKVKK